MGQYRKLVASLIGLGGMLASRYFGVDTDGLEPVVTDAVVAGLSAFGVWGVPNESKQ